MSNKDEVTKIKLEVTSKFDTISDICQTEESSQNNMTISKDCVWGWVVVFASLIASMLSDGIVYSYGVFTPEFVKHFGISRSIVGWMGSILVAITLGSGPLVSYLCERFGMRIVGVTGGIISAIGFALPFFYKKLWLVILGSSVVCGFGFGFVYLPSIVIVNVWFEKKRALAMGVAVCGSGLGAFVFSPLLQHLIVSFGWDYTMLITGGILLLLVPCCLTYISNENKTVAEKTKDKFKSESMKKEAAWENKTTKPGVENTNIEENINYNNQSDNIVTEAKKSFLEIIKNPIFILFVISNIFSSIGFNAPYMFAKDRAILAGLSDSKGSFLISSIGIGNCIGRVGFGYLATLKAINRFHLFNAAQILSGLVLIVSWAMNNYILMLGYTMFFGLFSGAFVTLMSIVTVDMFGLINLNRTFGVILVFQGLSVLFGPPLAGWIFDLTESFNIVFAVCGLFISFGGLVMYLAYLSKDFRKLKFNE